MASQDPSNVSAMAFDNPYDALIANVSAEEIQSRYELHRQSRNKSQRERLLSSTLQKFDIDQTLQKLIYKDHHAGFTDPRHCLVLWARPTGALKGLIRQIQQKLLATAPNLWIMPPENLHMTTFEIAQSLTKEEIDGRLATVLSRLEDITDYTFTHRTKLVKPMLSYDASAIALTFVPDSAKAEKVYTYHHVRRDLYNICKSTGVAINTRYVLPSAHLTIGRLVTEEDHSSTVGGKNALDTTKLRAWVKVLDDLNEWLQKRYWPEHGATPLSEGQWVVGQEKGLDCSRGTLWYGDGQRIWLGRGF